MNKRKISSIGQNVLLVVLSLLLALLTFVTWLDDLRLESLPTDSYLGKLYMDWNYGSGSFELRADEIPAAYPMAIAVQAADGMVGAQYQETTILALYQAVEPQLVSAITSTLQFAPADAQAYALALQEKGVFLQYDASLPYSLLATWMGGSISETLAVTSLWVTNAGQVWARDAVGDLYTASCTPFSTLWEMPLEELTLSPCTFAMSAYSQAQADTLIFADAPLQYAEVVENDLSLLESPVNPTVQSVLQAFSYEVYRSYFDTLTQTKVFVENNSTLRVSDAGNIRFRASSVEGALEAYGENEITDELSVITAYARRLLENVLRTLDTDASLRLTYAGTDPVTGNTCLTFGYVIAGIPVPTSEITVAQMEFHNHKLIAADLNLRSLRLTEQTTTILPIEQTLAMAQQGQGVVLSYLPTEQGFAPARCFTTP